MTKSMEVMVSPQEGDYPVANVYDNSANTLVGGFASIEGRENILIKQKVHLLEAAAQQLGCPCLELANEYQIFDADTGEEIIHVTEESGVCCRLCFSPYHEAKLHFLDLRNSTSANPYMMHAIKPFKCCCCAFADICRPELAIQDSGGNYFAHAKVPLFGGGFTPTIETMSRDEVVHSTVTGPSCCLGGLVELCKDMEFQIVYVDKDNNEVPGEIVKRRPGDLKTALAEAATDSDTYTIQFPPNMPPEEKASMIASTILLDYLYYEKGAPFTYNPLDGSCSVTFCSCYCMGCVLPCTCSSSKRNNSDE